MEKFGIISADKLFDRAPDESYLEEWSALLARPAEREEEAKEISLVVFRLSKDWFALPALLFYEISMLRTINSIDFHDPIVLGVINLRGQLRFCFSLHALLEIEKGPDTKFEALTAKLHYPRLLAIKDEKEIWTFPVEEVDGVYPLDLSKMSNVPVNVLDLPENYIKGVIKREEKKIYIINEEILFKGFRRRIL